MEKEAWLGVTPTGGKRGDEANAAAATVRREHQLLAENVKPESLLPRVQMTPRVARGPVSMKIWGTFPDLGATGNVLPTNGHAAKTGEDSAGRKGLSSRVWMKAFSRGVLQVGRQASHT